MSDTFTDKIEYEVCQGELSASDVYTKMMGYFGKDKARIAELEEAIREAISKMQDDVMPWHTLTDVMKKGENNAR